MNDFHPEPEQIAAFARWLAGDEIKSALAKHMPLCGGPRSACENRIADLAAVLQVFATITGEKEVEATYLSQVKNHLVKFEVGKVYTDRSICDYDTIYRFEVIARTAKQLTIRKRNETYRRGIYIYDGVECCKPHGTYWMCSIIRADRYQAS